MHNCRVIGELVSKRNTAVCSVSPLRELNPCPITQCYLAATGRRDIPAFTPSQLKLELDSDPGGCKAELA